MGSSARVCSAVDLVPSTAVEMAAKVASPERNPERFVAIEGL
jgi:hypothetical protein